MIVDDTVDRSRRETTKEPVTDLQLRHLLLGAISHAQAQFIAHASSDTVFATLLNDILALTQSEYGFIGEVQFRANGDPTLETLAMRDATRTNKTQQTPTNEAALGSDFFGLATHLHYVLNSRAPVIANNMPSEPLRGATSAEHPTLNAFMIIPLFNNNEIVGMFGLVNRPGGYETKLIKQLDTFLAACANLIYAQRASKTRYETQQQLDEHQSQLRAVLDTMTDGVITVGEKGVIESVNPAISRIFGYCTEELVGQHITLLLPPRYLTAELIDAHHNLGEHAPRLVGTTTEVWGRHKDGKELLVDLSIGDSTLGDTRHFTGVVRDISDRRDAKLKLREALELQQAILDNTSFSIFSTDLRGVIKTFNQAAEKMLGHRAKDVINKFTLDKFHEQSELDEHAATLTKQLDKEIETPLDALTMKARGLRSETRRWTYHHKDGSTFPVSLNVTALRDNFGNITGYLATATDMTAQDRANRLKNEFISTVSHELRTPLTPIKGSLGLITSNALGYVPEKIQPLIDIALQNAERLGLLINDILDIEKIDAGKMRFDMRAHSLSKIVREAITSTDSYAQQYDVQYKLVRDEPNAVVQLDAHRITQVITNLLSNAAKFSPADETVEVSIEQVAQGMRVAVSDFGAGIPDEFQTRVFQKFAQADSSSTRQKGGTGLGLAICKAIVDKHNGIIDFKTSSQGTTFFFDLPLGDGLDYHAPARTRTSSQTKTLLFTYDKPYAENLGAYLAKHQCDLDYATSLEEINDLLSQHRYDALILDTALSPTARNELFDYLNEEEKTPELSLILVRNLPGQNSVETPGQAIDLFCSLSKPIDPARLLEKISLALDNGNNLNKKVLHVEDDIDLARAVKALLEGNADVQHADTIEAAARFLKEQTFDLIVLDYNLPDGSGTTLLPLISRLTNEPRVAILSGTSTENHFIHDAFDIIHQMKQEDNLGAVINHLILKNLHKPR